MVEWFDDLKVGMRFKSETVTVSKDDIIRFAREYDPQPFHVDEAAALKSIYGGLIASGWHTGAMVMRMMCDAYLLESASMGSPGLDNLKWLRPVRPGDRITAYRTTLESRASRSRAEMGIVRFLWEVVNQNEEVVMSMEGYGLFGRRNRGP